MPAWALGVLLLTITAACGTALYMFTYSEITGVSDRIVKQLQAATYDQLLFTASYPAVVQSLAESGYLLTHGAIYTRATLGLRESYLHKHSHQCLLVYRVRGRTECGVS